MRSRDYECWVVDVTAFEEGVKLKRVEEGPVPLVRKMSDTSRHARAALVLQAGRKVSALTEAHGAGESTSCSPHPAELLLSSNRQYILQWRRTAICGSTEAEAQDPLVTSVWVNIALNGKTIGEGLLSDLNQETRSSLDGIVSSTALTGSPLWGDSNGAPAGLTGKLSISFYRSPEVIRRALRDRAYSEPQSPQSPSMDQSCNSSSIVRRSALLFRSAAHPAAPTVFNFFFEVAADVQQTPQALPQSVRRSVSTKFEDVLSWSKTKGRKALQQPSDDGAPISLTPDGPAGSIEDESSEEEQNRFGGPEAPVPAPSGAKEKTVLGRPRAATLRAINGRFVVVSEPYKGSRGSGTTVDTDYELRGRPRAATMAAPVLPSQRSHGMTSANTFLSAISAFQGERTITTRPRRALSDTPAPWWDQIGVADGCGFEALQEEVAATTGLVEGMTSYEVLKQVSRSIPAMIAPQCWALG